MVSLSLARAESSTRGRVLLSISAGLTIQRRGDTFHRIRHLVLFPLSLTLSYLYTTTIHNSIMALSQCKPFIHMGPAVALSNASWSLRPCDRDKLKRVSLSGLRTTRAACQDQGERMCGADEGRSGAALRRCCQMNSVTVWELIPKPQNSWTIGDL